MNGHNRGQASAWYPVEQDGFEVSVVVSEIVLIYNECSTAHTADRKYTMISHILIINLAWFGNVFYWV